LFVYTTINGYIVGPTCNSSTVDVPIYISKKYLILSLIKESFKLQLVG